MASLPQEEQEINLTDQSQQIPHKPKSQDFGIICLKVCLAISIFILIYFLLMQPQFQMSIDSVSINHQQDMMQHHLSIGDVQNHKANTNNQIKNSYYLRNISPHQISQMNILEHKNSFTIPRYVWVFVQDVAKQTIFVQSCLNNIQHFAGLSKFQVKFVNTSNYKQFVTTAKSNKIEKTIEKLKKRMEKYPNSNLKDHINTIQKNLITLQILNEKGGILVQKNIVFTENFDWIEQIRSNIYVNKGSKQVEPKYIAFYDMDHSSPLQKQNKLGVTYETERYMIKFPSVQPYFLVAKQKEEYLPLVMDVYYSILLKPQNLQSNIKQTGVILGALQGKDIYYEALFISFQMALQDKQKKIDAEKSQTNTFAIDYFGLFTINQRYFPKKLQFTFENSFQEKIYTNLAKYTLQQLQQAVGPLRYIVSMAMQSHINYRLQKTYLKDKRYFVHPDSFLAKYIILDESQEFIISTIQHPFVQTDYRPWTSLPKIIWLFWDTGLENSSLGNKLCIENIRRYAKVSKFDVREVNNSNIEYHLGSQLYNKIQRFISNQKITVFSQTLPDFTRIALIAKHGGIYMDASYFSVQSLEWIINIANYPSQYIFNRYGKLPKVLMLFHPHFGQPFQWEYDLAANTKNMWLSAYENNLIIAEPNQQFLWDWLEEYGRFIGSPYEVTDKLMEQYHVRNARWTSQENVYLAAMDSVKNIIGRKQNEIIQKMKQAGYTGAKSAAQYYGIWSMSGYRGQQKFRAHTNYDNTHFKKPHNSDNVFLWRYPQSYSQQIFGKVNQLVKLYGWNIKFLNKVLLQSYQSNFLSQIHPDSFFSKYLYNQSVGIIKKEGQELNLIKLG